MMRAEPRTTSKAAAVITSRACTAASSRKKGLSSQRPAPSTTAIAAAAIRIANQAGSPPSSPPGARKATSASSGTIARSSSSRIDTIRWPSGVAVSPRSERTCATTAVEVRTKPMAAKKATFGVSPKPMPTPVSSRPQTATCAAPSPKMSRRRLHNRDGCISSPITNRNITTPSSATCRMACGLVNRAQPERADGEPGGEIAEHRAEAEPDEDRRGDHAGGEQHHHLDEVVSAFGRRHSVSPCSDRPNGRACKRLWLVKLRRKSQNGHRPHRNAVAQPSRLARRTRLNRPDRPARAALRHV